MALLENNIMANPDTVINTPLEDFGLISTTTTDDGIETSISGPESGSGSRTQITLKYKDTEFKEITLLQKDKNSGKEKGKIHLYSHQSILELKRFLNEMSSLDLENLSKGKLVYGNITGGTEMLDNISSWYDSDPDICQDLLIKLLSSKGKISGEDLQNLIDRKEQYRLLKGIVNDDLDVISVLKEKYSRSQTEKVIEDFLKDNSWILGLSLDAVEYNKIDDSLDDLKKIQESVPGRPEHNFDLLTETTVVNIVELKLVTEKLFNIGDDSHGNPKWNPKFFEYVTQIQNYKRVLEQIGDDGMVPEGKKIIFPKTFLIIGRLLDMSDNQKKVFDMYRKNLKEPQIITYDELLERAEKIANSSGIKKLEKTIETENIDNIPF